MAGIDDLIRSILALPSAEPQSAPPGGVRLAPPLERFPTSEDAAFARDAGIGYGSGHEAFLSGQVSRAFPDQLVGRSIDDISAQAAGLSATAGQGSPDLGDLLTRAMIATRRNPVAAIGFDPRNIAFDRLSGEGVNLAGFYDPAVDQIVSNAAFPSNVVHEAAHRGLRMLRDRGLVPADLDRMAPEEDIVRYLMARHAGDPERGSGQVGDMQRRRALHRFERSEASADLGDLLDQLIRNAQQFEAQRRPGGPR